MLKIVPILFFIIFLHEKAAAQCDTAFTATTYGATVELKAHDSASGKTHKWYFGDGNWAWGTTVWHTYGFSGTYLVKHIIYDSVNNCRDSSVKPIHIYVPQVCTASITWAVNPAFPKQYYFHANANDSIIAQHWVIAPCDSLYRYDSTTYSTPNPVHNFTRKGCHQVCVRIIMNNGCIKTVCDTLYVQCDSSQLRTSAPDRISSNPNPVYSTPVTISLNLKQSEKVMVTVYNASGNLVYRNEKGYVAGNNRINIPVEGLNRGTYYVYIRYGQNRKQSIFQKL